MDRPSLSTISTLNRELKELDKHYSDEFFGSLGTREYEQASIDFATQAARLTKEKELTEYILQLEEQVEKIDKSIDKICCPSCNSTNIDKEEISGLVHKIVFEYACEDCDDFWEVIK